MKVLVTGGAGFIGRHTVRQLLAEDVDVIVLDDFSSGDRRAMDEFTAAKGFELVAGDACQPALVRSVMAKGKPDAVVHLAGLVSVYRCLEEPGLSWRSNVLSTRVVATEAEAAGCRCFVFASSAAVYAASQCFPLREDAQLPPALSPYGAHKAEAEQWLMATSTPRMERIALRYFNVYGRGQSVDSPYSGVITRFFHGIASGGAVQVFGDGEQSRDFVHIRDLVSVNVQAAAGRLSSGTYNVCTGIATSINDVLVELTARFPSIRIERLPARAGEVRFSRGSATRLSAALGGWQPLPFAAGLRELLDRGC